MRKKITLCLSLGLLLLGALVAGGVSYSRYWVPKSRRDWKNAAIAEIAALTRDNQWIARQIAAVKQQRKEQPSGAWVGDQIVLMADGQWIVFRQNCGKEERKLGDLFIGKGSDGKWYYSSFHFCVRMTTLAMDPQPKNLQEFVNRYYLNEFDGKSDDALQPTWPRT